MNFRFTLNNTTEGEYILTKSPIGWQDTELAIKRSDAFKGLFYDFSLKLKFFCGGAGKEYIDNIIDLYGVEAEVLILIEIDCLDSGDFETAYEGVLNLSSYEQTETAPQYTIVKIEQAGIEQTIVNRYDTTVNLNKLETIDGTELTALTYGPYTLNLHSKEIIYSSYLGIPGFPDPAWFIEADFGTGIAEEDLTWYLVPNIGSIEYDDIPGVSIPGIQVSSIGSVQGAAPRIDPVFQNPGGTATYQIYFKYEGELSDLTDNPTPDDFLLNIRTKVGPTWDTAVLSHLTTIGSYVTPGGSVPVDVPISIDTTFSQTVPTNEYLWLYFEATGFHVNGTKINGIELRSDCGYLKISEETTTTGTTCKAFGVYEAGVRILQSITDLTDPFRSDFFGRLNAQPYAATANGCGSFTAITNGFQIRSFPIDDSDVAGCAGSQTIQGRPIYSSLKDYFESLSAIYNLGLGIEKSGSNYYVRIEPIEYFFSTDVLFEIPNIKGLKIRNAEEFYVNGFEVGFDKWENEAVNGLDEVNTKREYTLKLKKTGTKISKVSKLIASPYALEFTRRKQFIDGSTEDSKYDQENFIICLNRTVNGYTGVPTGLATAEKNENFTSISNLISATTTYNMRLWPGRIVRNWYKTIAASVIKMNDTLKEVKFAFGQGNYKAISKGTDACDFANQATIDESADLEIELPASNTEFEPIFEPIFFEFEAQLSFTRFNLIKANPTKCLEISTTDGNFIKAFIFDVRYKPVTGKATFILLKAYQPETDCSHIYVESGYVECDYVE